LFVVAIKFSEMNNSERKFENTLLYLLSLVQQHGYY